MENDEHVATMVGILVDSSDPPDKTIQYRNQFLADKALNTFDLAYRLTTPPVIEKIITRLSSPKPLSVVAATHLKDVITTIMCFDFEEVCNFVFCLLCVVYYFSSSTELKKAQHQKFIFSLSGENNCTSTL